MLMTNIQMLKRKYILRGWIDLNVTKYPIELYRTLMKQRHKPNRKLP